LIEVGLTSGEINKQFYDLVWPQADMVLRYAHVLCRSPSDAEDLAQESLLKAFKSLGQFRSGTDIRAWLVTILRHTHIDRIRKHAAMPNAMSLDQIEHEPADRANSEAAKPGDWHDEQKLLERFSDAAIIDALRRLPLDIRWTVLLVEVENLDLKEASAVLDVPIGTVKSRCHRGREMLRVELERIADRSELVRKSISDQEQLS
jgi:RNA polymerase sigma-70 factor (ECF subfamily)